MIKENYLKILLKMKTNTEKNMIRPRFESFKCINFYARSFSLPLLFLITGSCRQAVYFICKFKLFIILYIYIYTIRALYCIYTGGQN